MVTRRGPFAAKRLETWFDHDLLQASGEWYDSPAEAAVYETEVREAIARRLAPSHASPIHTRSSPVARNSADRKEAAETGLSRAATLNPVTQGSFYGRPSAPSFNPSRFRETSTPHSRSTPNVSTPSTAGPSRLPPPPAGSRANRSRSLMTPRAPGTPDAVDSPIDTPQTSRQSHLAGSIAEGQASRDPSATPVPLGTPIEKLRRKPDFVTLSKHFEQITVRAAKEQADASATTARKGRARRAVVRQPTVGLGGKIFQGFRILFPPDVNSASINKTRGEIVTKLGAIAVARADTAITHVIWDKHSAMDLARLLGLESLTDLPAGNVCVKYDWVLRSREMNQALSTTPFLSFPAPVLTNAPVKSTLTRLTDITDQLKGKSISIRRREHTASDSDTESPFKRPRLPVAARPKSSTELPIARRPSTRAKPTIDTVHVLPKGPAWERIDANQQDGLDVMITGILSGKHDEEADSDNDGHSETGKPEDLHAHSSQTEISAPNSDDKNPDQRAAGFQCGQSHSGSKTPGPNEALAKYLDDMHELYEGAEHKDFFAIRNYRLAAASVRRADFAIISGAQARERLRGIGQGLADRIDEFLSGAQGRLFFEQDDKQDAISEFRKVYGIGRKLANDLYRRGARTLDDLRTKDFGLSRGQMIGLDLYDELNSRIPREECKAIYDIIHEEAVRLDPKVWVEIMGSYRRGQDNSGDVDILITRDTRDGLTHAGLIKRLVSALKKRGTITHDLSEPSDWMTLEAKWMGVGKVDATGKHRRIDILAIPFENWGAALIYFTGNEIFNRSLRLYARKQGYRLNQRGLYKGVARNRDGTRVNEGELVASRTEQEIFDVLGIRWRHPHQRRP